MPQETRTPLGLVRVWAFPIALLLFGTLFLGGRIGFWSDDYWHNLRHPVTGALPPLNWGDLSIDRQFFLRPLFYRVVPPVVTLSWTSQWPAHLAMILAHALVVWLLWRLMRTIGLSRCASSAAGLAFLVYPAHFEAVFWVSALPTTLATALMLWVLTCTANFAQRRGAFARRWGWLLLLALPVAAFEVCCLNEQPAMGVLAMPMIYWAARAGAGGCEPVARETAPASCARALLPAFFCGVAVLVYVWLLTRPDIHKPVGARGAPDQFVTIEQLPRRTQYFFDVLWRRLTLWNFGPGALRMGVAEVKAAGTLGWLALGAVLATGLMWAREWRRHGRCGLERAGRPGPAWLLAAAAGVAIFLTGWIPIFILCTYDPDSRTRYWPATGLAMAGAAGVTALGVILRARAIHAAARGGCVLACIAGALMLVGVQRAFLDRWELDAAQGRQLRALLPDPAPLTFFVPLDIRSTGIRTGSPVFDSHFRSVWEFPWTSLRYIQTVYRNDDVRAGFWRSWSPGEPVRGADETGIHYTVRLGPRFPRIEGSGSRVAWDRAVPYIIDEHAAIRLITEVVIVGPGDTETTIAIPQVARRPGVPRLAFRLPRA